jgi:carbamoyltransferase
MIKILGISAFYHDSAACLVIDGKIIAAAQEERFTRIKQDESFPQNAINFCLEKGKIAISEVDYVVFYEKPFLKFERLLETYLSFAPKGYSSYIKAIPIWIKDKIWIRENIKKKLNYSGEVLFTEHHESHAASAFFPSPFQKAAVLTMDGVGEWATTTYGIGENNKITLTKEIRFPHSLGLLYSAFTYYLGFKVNSGEYKVMGLASYGEPIYKDKILSELIDVKEDGSFRLNLDYFNFHVGLTMTSKKFHRLFGAPPRKPETLLTQREMDIARSIQDVTEEIFLKIGKQIYKETKQKNLVLAGGVALNCVATGRLLREGDFDNIWVQPAAGDAGGALGAALFVWYQYLGNARKANEKKDFMRGSLLGPDYSEKTVKNYLDKNSIAYKRLDSNKLTRTVASLLAEEKVVGWFSGPMEFGPRALGARSILGDARSLTMQKNMNLKIKFRESFRPFAPVVLKEKVSKYFDFKKESPYMLLVANVKKSLQKKMDQKQRRLFGIDKLNVVRSVIPAVTHVDYSARLQTISREDNPRFYDLLNEFDRQTNCPVLINTSFNVRGEPIVCTPDDAYKCFMRTNIDYLVLWPYLLDKKNQKKLKGDINWKERFVLD